MMFRTLATFALFGFATAATAQVPATKAPQVPATKAPQPPATKSVLVPATKSVQAPATKSASPTGTKTTTTTPNTGTATGITTSTKAGRPILAEAPEAARVRAPVIMRELFDYGAEGRRDPFASLLSTAELRPNVADLTLVGVLLDPRRPIAVMREAGTNTQYRVTTGMMLGRMRVAQIKRRTVIFSIEEFGLNRLDSLMLGDSTKARTK